MYENVLVPTDGSDGMDRVVEHAIHVALMAESTLHVLHVVDTAVAPLDSHSQSTYDWMEAARRASVVAIRDRALDAGIHTIETVRRGTPYREILEYAAENDVDLVVIGTHGRTGLRRTLLGSTAERVVRLSDVPVLTVRTTPVARA